jgi:RNA polymerase sigma factor (sigma-70 family)
MRSIPPSTQVPQGAVLKHPSDELLVSQAKLGDERAFTELWSRHGKKAHSIIWRIVRNRDDAEDILQEVYVKSFLHLVSFNGESRFSTWLSRIAINAALMLLRKRRTHPEAFISGSESSHSAQVIDFADRSENAEMSYLRAERLHQ